MTIQLREYQQRTADKVRELASSGIRRILMVQPTGAGKTYTMADLALSALNKGNKVLCLMHRRGLVDQMMDRFNDFGIDSGCIMAGVESSTDLQCQIASLWTYSRRIKLAEKEYNQFWVDAPVVLIDEAHHVLNNTYQNILKQYTNAFVIGCTATPTLSTGAGLGRYFQGMVDEVSMNELLEGGHLVPGNYYGPSEPDLRKVPTLLGDWTIKGLDKEINKGKIIGEVVENWIRHGEDRQSMVFAVNRKHARALCNEFVRHGVTSEYLDAHNSDDDRNDVLRRFRSGDIRIICQVALYTEGTDIQEIECLVIARPTKSLGLHRQILGRGARPYSGKKDFLVLDHGGNCKRLGFYEDEINWVLTDKPMSNQIHKKTDKPKVRIICDKCSGINEVTGEEDISIIKNGKCYRCGHEIKNYGKKVEEVQAELVQLKGKPKNKQYTKDEKTLWMGMFEYYRREKGYQPGWAAHKYREKIGCWPKGVDGPPIEPNQEFKNWMKHLAIKYKKSKQKQEQQCA